jgi:molybdate transport system ATP-binding protein
MLKIRTQARRDAFTLDVSIDMEHAGVLALFGRSGCGKSTLVNIIAGLLKADTSHIEIDGVVLEDSSSRLYVEAERRKIGYVFQDARLFPHLNIGKNLTYGLQRAGKQPLRVSFESVVALLGLEHLLNRRPHQLSGGERQRVALGRALLSQPRVLLLDEPLASLDAARREEVLPYLERLRDEFSIPMIYVSHQFEEVLRLATHVVLMADGRSIAQGPLDVMSLHSQMRAIVGADAIGAVIAGVIEAADEQTGLAAVRIGENILNVSLRGVRPGAHVRIQLLARDLILATLRPEAVSVRNILKGSIARIVADDADTDLVYVDLGGALVFSRVTRAASLALALRAGMTTWVLVKSVSIRGHAFVSQSGALVDAAVHSCRASSYP